MNDAATVVHRFRCDASEWEFEVATTHSEVVAWIYRRGERYGPEFRGEDQVSVQRSIARWLLAHADRVGGLH